MMVRRLAEDDCMSEMFESDRLPALSDFLGELASAVNVDPEMIGEQMTVSEIKVDLPFELQVSQDLAKWQLDAAPPTQIIETTVMPVWHRVRMTVSLNDGRRGLEAVES
jgi:hypothetical protein